MTKVKINSVVTNKVSKRKNAPLVKGKVVKMGWYSSPSKTWYEYAMVKPNKGKAVRCLVKNLTVVK